MIIEKIGIIGAGTRGTAIAYLCLLAGYSVFLHDHSDTSLRESLDFLNRTLDRHMARNRLPLSEKERILSHLKHGTDLMDLENCHLVIEAIPENQNLKHVLFKEITSFLPSDCLLTTTTYSCSVTALAVATDRPQSFMGMHFLNPILMGQLVELVRGFSTAPRVVSALTDVVRRLGKDFVVSEDYPGFLVNRIFLPLINEAAYALYEGVGSIETIDKAMRLGTNQSLGPLELADLMGLDKCVSLLTTFCKELGDRHRQPCPLLVKYVEANWLGRKTNRGFYDYTGENPVPTDRRNHDIS